jgi:hypothetical protein
MLWDEAQSEGIAYDRENEVLYLGSLTEPRIYRQDLSNSKDGESFTPEAGEEISGMDQVISVGVMLYGNRVYAALRDTSVNGRGGVAYWDSDSLAYKAS